jgi:hypothetical protein
MTLRYASITAASLALLVFSTPTPAPQVPSGMQEGGLMQMPEAAASATSLTQLSAAQTDAIKALNAKLIALDKRITALEKKKENDHG